MSRTGNRWQLVLFLGAVLLPSAVLVVVSQRTIQQNRELAGKRRLDERRALRERMARELLARAEQLRAAALAIHGNLAPEVAMIASVVGGRLALPWETDPNASRFRELVAAPEFASAVARGDRAQFAEKDPGAKDPSAAARHFREALRLGRDPVQAAYARLLLARALKQIGQNEEAAKQARLVAQSPTGLVDEDGVPLRLHAAVLLAESPAEAGFVRQCLSETASDRWWPSPPVTYLLSTLADLLGAAGRAPDAAWAGAYRTWVAAAVRRQEQMQTLQSEAERMGLLAARAAPSWTYFPGQEPWLVSTMAGPDGVPRVVAVQAKALLAPLEKTADVRFLAATEPGGELLGDSFPALKIQFATVEDASGGTHLQTAVYYAALFALVGAAIFGAWLLWRSLRREVELAETRAQFVASVSHELKTPLTAIRMYAETLQMGRPLDEHVRGEYLETIVAESERLSRLVDDVLLFSKIEQGKKTYRSLPVALGDTLRSAARTLAYPLAQKQFALRVEIDEAIPDVKGDPDALEQAVLNLLTNAVKYSGESREIGLRLRQESSEAVVEVTDHGVGIAAGEQARVFEKYYRVPGKDNEAIPGAGLGLALVAQIVKAHGGRVELVSSPGEGSTFVIRLPLGSGT
jgi:signal transduction histidine kinase